MDFIDIKDFKKDGLAIQVSPIPAGLKIKISGSMEVRDASDPLYEYINNVHEQVIGKQLTRVELDLVRLSFMNSSAISVLVGWFAKLPDLPKKKSYTIDILYDSNVHWQNSGLTVLKKVAEDHLRMIPSLK